MHRVLIISASKTETRVKKIIAFSLICICDQLDISSRDSAK